MTSISGFAYIVIGFGVGAVSVLLHFRNKTGPMILFAFIGAVLIIVGVIKLLVQMPKPKHQKQHHDHRVHHTHHSQNAHNRIEQAIRAQQQQEVQVHAHHPAHHPHQATRHSPAHHSHQPVKHSSAHHSHKRTHHTTPTHPPVVVCPRCHTRQYKTKAHCFKCHGPI